MKLGKGKTAASAALTVTVVVGVAAWASANHEPKQSLQELRAEIGHSIEAPSKADRKAYQQAAKLEARAERGEELDVGDASSFGRPVKWAGLMSTPNVQFRADCSQVPADPNTRCVTVTGGHGYEELNDLDSITLPGKSINSFLCHVQTPLVQVSFLNNSSQPNRRMVAGMYPHITVDSPVFSDPSLTDPQTGVPLNGSLKIFFSTAVAETTLQPGESAFVRNASTRSCIGGFLTRANLAGFYGLSPRQIDDFFAQPIRLRLGADVIAIGVQSGAAHLGYRFTSD